MDPDGRPDVMKPVPIGRDLKDPSFERLAVVVANDPFVMLAEDFVKRLSGPGNEGRSFLRSPMGKFGIEGRKIDLGQGGVGRFHRRDSRQGQLFGKTLLIVRKASSLRPRASGKYAAIISMPSCFIARPNGVRFFFSTWPPASGVIH